MSLGIRFKLVAVSLSVAAALLASGTPRRSGSVGDERQTQELRSLADLQALRMLPGRAGASCDAAVRTAEFRHRLPSGLLFAISQVESGRPDPATRRLEPWPWTIQAEGRGIFFQSKGEAVQWVKDARARGVTSIDTGCLQVNLFYHPHAFESPEEAFDPERNADYAARFLLQLHAATGDWAQATGFYHSQTLTLAATYRERVGRALNGEPLGQAGGMVAWPLPPKPPSTVDHLAAAWRATLQSQGVVLPNPTPADAAGHDWNSLSSLKQLAKPLSPWQPQRLPHVADKTFLSSNIKRLQ